MGWRLPFGDDEVPKYDVVAAVVALIVIGVLVAWGLGWI